MPSTAPPNLITIPVPTPRKIPPNTKASNVSVTNGSTGCNTIVERDITIMPTSDENANVLPICLYPIIRKGRLNMNRNIPRGRSDKYDDITEIPVIPPSVIILGTRNNSKATATMKAPIMMNIPLMIILPRVRCLCSRIFLKSCFS
ncbi:hypothetical protein D3C77_592040 [compost metagenome]